MSASRSSLLLACLAGVAACGGDLALPGTAPGPEEPLPLPELTAADDRFSAPADVTLLVPAPGVLANDQVDGAPNPGLQAVMVDGPSHGRVDLGSDGSLEYTPDASWLGSDRFTYRAKLDSTASPAAEVVIDVAGRANVAPSFVPGADQRVSGKRKERKVEPWATAISPGPAAEAGQRLSFLVTVVSGADALAGVPTISDSGTLTYKPSKESGSAVLEVRLQDDGGTDNGGQDTSPAHTLVITVTGDD